MEKEKFEIKMRVIIIIIIIIQIINSGVVEVNSKRTTRPVKIGRGDPVVVRQSRWPFKSVLIFTCESTYHHHYYHHP